MLTSPPQLEGFRPGLKVEYQAMNTNSVTHSSTQQSMEPLALRCCDCGLSFAMSIGEQRWFAERDLDLPRRCKPCRQLRKACREGDSR